MQPSRPKAKARAIPITGRSIFMAETKPQVQRQHPDLTRLEAFILLNGRWSALDDAARSRYEKRADYARRSAARREQFSKQKPRQEPRISPYSIFVRKHHEMLKRSNPEMSVGERSRAIAALWSQMSSADRVPFVNEAKRETRKLRRGSDDEDVEAD